MPVTAQRIQWFRRVTHTGVTPKPRKHRLIGQWGRACMRAALGRGNPKQTASWYENGQKAAPILPWFRGYIGLSQTVNDTSPLE